MIYCVWYPSGGFGHFINAVLTLHGDNFVRPSKSLEFSKNGNSHNLDLIVPKYLHECWSGGIEFRNDKNYCVLIDNGINHESTQFKSTFPNSTVIKICYTYRTWPIVARTMIDKAMESSIEEQLPIDIWNTNEPWAQREKYFLFLRDHPLRHAWKPSNVSYNIFIEDLIDYSTMVSRFDSIDVAFDDFKNLHTQWLKSNSQYFDPVLAAEKFINGHLLNTPISDIWTQAIVYYQIWCQYGIEVPHNDFADFFQSQSQFQEWLKSSV